MPTIFSKGNFYLGSDHDDESYVTDKQRQFHISVHIWNYRLEYDYMQPSPRNEKHYDTSSTKTAGNGPNQTFRSADGQNPKGDRNNKGPRS